jgi:hypothetical protein
VNRNLTIRLFLGTLVIAVALIVFSYARVQASRQDDPATNGEGKCEGTKSQSPFVLWESLTHNFLISKR